MKNGVLEMILQAGPLVKVILALLLMFSVISWAIIFFKHKYLSQAEKENREFQKELDKAADRNELLVRTRRLTLSPLANLCRAGSGANSPEKLKRALRKQTEAETYKMEKYLNFLATTGSTTPFIGLFGTVWGIMNSFRGIGLKGSASLAVVAPGIAEALIATAMGLAAAIPAVMAYNYYLGWTRRLISEMETASEDIEASLLVPKKKADGTE